VGDGENEGEKPAAVKGSSVPAQGLTSGTKKPSFPKWNTWKDFWRGRVPPASEDPDKESTPEKERETRDKETEVSTTMTEPTDRIRCFFCHAPGHFAHQCVIRSQERLEGWYRSTIGDRPLTRKEWGKLSYDQKTGGTRGHKIGENTRTAARTGAGN